MNVAGSFSWKEWAQFLGDISRETNPTVEAHERTSKLEISDAEVMVKCIGHGSEANLSLNDILEVSKQKLAELRKQRSEESQLSLPEVKIKDELTNLDIRLRK